jgi:uncharacterized protein YjbI with pentapeptide repeats/Flp pilus assembly protein TadD
MRDLPKSRDKEFMFKLLQDGKIEQFNIIRKEEDMPLNLRNVDLSKKMLRGADLHDADLTEAILAGSVLGMANLNGANLIRANLKDVDLRAANLQGANLTKADLSNADLRTADFKGMVDFSEANLSNADLRAADLSGMVNFNRATLDGTDFTGSIDNQHIYLKDATIHEVKGLERPETNEYLEALKSYSKAISQQFKTLHTQIFQVMSIEQKVGELVKLVRDIDQPEKISWTRKKELGQTFVELAEKVIDVLPDTSAFTILRPFDKLIELQNMVDAAGLVSKAKMNGKLAKYNEAIEYFSKAIAIMPDYAGAWKGKGFALYQYDQYEEATKCYDKAIEINPDYAEAWYDKGILFMYIVKDGSYFLNESLKYYDKDIQRNPTDFEAWHGKGNVFRFLTKYEEAIKSYDKAIEINPDYTEAWYHKGTALNMIRKYEESRKCYDKAEEINPDYVKVLGEMNFYDKYYLRSYPNSYRPRTGRVFFSRKKFKCDMCKEKFKTERELITHKKLTHGISRWLTR